MKAPEVSRSPAGRAWQRFKRNRLGYWSLIAFVTLVVISLFQRPALDRALRG